MEIRHLKYFQMVASVLNISHAAVRLNISQSSVTRAIQELEEEAGTALLSRNSTGVTLTASGQKFFVHSNRILALLNDALRDIRCDTESCMKINVGFCPGILALEFVESLRDSDFDVSAMRFFEFDLQEQINALRNEKIDVALVRYSNGMYVDKNYEDFSFIIFKQLRMYAVLPVTHRLAGKKSISLIDLRNESFVTLSDAQYEYTKNIFFEFCDIAGFIPHISMESNGSLAALATIAAGSCVGIFPKSIVSTTLPGIVYIPIQDYDFSVEVSCIYKKDEKRAHTLEFIKALKAHFEK